MVLETDGDQLDRSCKNEEVLLRVMEGRQEHPAYSEKNESKLDR